MNISNIDSKERCRYFRKRILEVSQNVQALHIGSAYSCTEIVDTIYFELMEKNEDSSFKDVFLMSKGHGCMIQYVILEELGILSENDIKAYCTSDGILGCHPDYENPGITASTGALGHGLSMALGIAYSRSSKKDSGKVFCVVSDGELQEGSTWEAILMASSLKVNNLVLFIDNNDFQSLGRTSQTHPSFYPVKQKLEAFGWQAFEVDGHSFSDLVGAIKSHNGSAPLAINCKTTKGKGISYMENVPIWHYRSPNREEYIQALGELGFEEEQ